MINIDKQIYKDMLRDKKMATQQALNSVLYFLYRCKNEDGLYLEVYERNLRGISTTTRAKIRHKVYPDDKELIKLSKDDIYIKMLEYVEGLIENALSDLKVEKERIRNRGGKQNG